MNNKISGRWYLPYFFMLPSIICILVVYVVPFLGSIYLSMTDWNGIRSYFNFIGLQNFRDILKETDFDIVLGNHLKYFLILVPVLNAVAILLAVLLNGHVKGKNIFRTIIFLPAIIAPAAIGFIWGFILDPVSGPLNLIAEKLGLHFLMGIQWLGDPNLAIYTISFVSMWEWVGWGMVIYLAGLQTIPAELYESCDIDGASPIRKLFHITVPMLAPSITINIVMFTLGSLKLFDLPYIMTRGGPGNYTETLSISIYNESFLVNKVGYGAALSLVLFVLILIVSLVQTHYLRKFEDKL